MTDEDKKKAGGASEDALRACDQILDHICDAYGVAGTKADQLKFVVAIYLLGTVAQRAGLTKEYALEQVAKMLPGAMDASEADEHEDIHRGSVPS